MMDVPPSIGIAAGSSTEALEPPTPLAAWHRPPTIIPNLGAKAKRNRIVLPKSQVQHVLLHENKNQHNMLSSKVNHMTSEFKRSSRLFELHKRSFLVRQSYKQVGLWERGIDHVLLMPELVVALHCPEKSKKDAMQSAAARRMAALKEGAALIKAKSANPQFRSRSKSHGDVVESTERKQRVDSSDTNSKHNVMDNTADNTIQNFKKSLANYFVTKHKAKNNKASISVEDMSKLMNGDRSKTAPSLKQQQLKQDSFTTKEFSTYNYHNNYRREATVADTSPHRTPANKASLDPRFQRLRNQLIPSEKSVDTFVHLSPSGGQVVEKYGRSLYKEKDLKRLLDKYNDVSFISTRRQLLNSDDKRPDEGENKGQYNSNNKMLLPVQDTFVDDNSLYSSLNQSWSSLEISDVE